MKRSFDLILAIPLLVAFALPMLLVAAAIKLSSKGPALYWSKRVGRNNKIFLMPKFRSMKINTPQIATHLVQNPSEFLIPIGNFLRRTSLDELPQIFSVLAGDMSFVGPRPALFNQDDLIALRTSLGVHVLTPGITGWAQINGRDELPIPVKVDFDKYYLDNQTLTLDIKIIILTALKVLRRDGIQH